MGEFMAQNPLWCQPLSQWKDYFTKWVKGFDPETQVRFGIFFDFRTAYGEQSLTDELKKHVFTMLAESRGFFLHLSEIAKRFNSHLNVFGNISLEKKGVYKNYLEIKSTVESVVFLARLYAFLYQLDAVNTVERLDRLAEKKVIYPGDRNEIVEAYNTLIKLRILNQLMPGNEDGGLEANFLDPEDLDAQSRRALKKSLKAVRRFSRRMNTLKNHVAQINGQKKTISYQYVNLEK
jgi:CBS domain-containing protein